MQLHIDAEMPARGEGHAPFRHGAGRSGMRITVFALLSVVFLDLMNQGLVIPILNAVVMDPSYAFCPNIRACPRASSTSACSWARSS